MRTVLPSVAFLALTGLVLAQDANEKELKSLQGVWKVTKIQNQNAELVQKLEEDGAIKFDDDKVSVLYKGERLDDADSRIKLDGTKKPKHINFIDPQGNEREGIYELDKGVLKIAVNDAGQGRPTEFNYQAGTTFAYAELKKEKK
ncbi:MAG: TIGR03067 domain-containing protein [Gemmataceae bacterium]|nr:TIGR03067 domain-containing protein [Gemmataceae bacterium]MCI0739955.1 TIGR03067 domain-containing protein [Gemmataceae bacterium]